MGAATASIGPVSTDVKGASVWGHAEFSEKVAMLGACGSRESLHPFANKKKVPGVGGGIPGMLSVPVWVLAMH